MSKKKQLPVSKKIYGDEYTEKSRLPSLLMPALDFIYKKLLLPNTAGSHDLTVYLLQGNIVSLEH